jgi:hypothetical protein
MGFEGGWGTGALVGVRQRHRSAAQRLKNEEQGRER